MKNTTEEKCKICNKITDSMYKLNDGLYCERCLDNFEIEMEKARRRDEYRGYDRFKGEVRAEDM